jgi:hypothetical protein
MDNAAGLVVTYFAVIASMVRLLQDIDGVQARTMLSALVIALIIRELEVDIYQLAKLLLCAAINVVIVHLLLSFL